MSFRELLTCRGEQKDQEEEERGESQHDAEVGPPGGGTARSSADETLAGPSGLPSGEKESEENISQTAETTLYRLKLFTCTVG